MMPYTSGSQSGIIQLAFGANKPVIVSNTESISDLVKHNENGLIVKPKDPKALANAIIEFFQSKKAKKYVEFIREDKKKFEWNEGKEKILFHGL